jgi:phosphoglycolate phosphatase-like HAD superfamily hydrolase
MHLLLFDLDATLVLTGGSGLIALNRSFQKLFSIENAMSGVAPHGKTDPAIIREIFAARFDRYDVDDALIASVLELYMNLLHEEVEQSASYRVLPGIDDILLKMSARKEVLLGLATGNVEPGARIKLRRGNLNRYFPFGGYGSDSAIRSELVARAALRAHQAHRQEIEAEKTFVIGDTPLDIAAGRQAGFRTVGVATGQFSVEQLQQCGADIVIPDFESGRDHFLRSIFME